MDNLFQDVVPRSEQALPLHTKLEDRYDIGRVIAETETSFSYHAKDLQQNCVVVVQELFPKQWVTRKSGDPIARVRTTDGVFQLADAIDRCMKDAEKLMRLKNSGLAQVSDAFKANSTVYIVSENFDGILLGEWQQRQNGQVSEKMALQIGLLILAGLKDVHDQGIIHRNLSPNTILIDGGGRVKLSGMGMNPQMLANPDLNKMTAYDAPELYYANMSQGTWTDLYSVGGVLYHLLTSQTPALSSERVKQDLIIPAKQWNYLISDGLNQVITKLLSLDPTARFQNVGELAKTLHPIYKGASTQTNADPPVAPKVETKAPSIEIPPPMIPISDNKPYVPQSSSQSSSQASPQVTRDMPAFSDSSSSSMPSVERSIPTDAPPTAFAKAMTTSDWMNTSEASKGWEDAASAPNDWSKPSVDVPPPIPAAAPVPVSAPPIRTKAPEPTTREVLESVKKETPIAKNTLPPIKSKSKSTSKVPIFAILGVVLLGAIGGGAWWFFSRETLVPVKLAVTPSGARITLKPLSGDVIKATSPATLSLKEGEYELSIHKEGFIDVVQKIRISAAEGGKMREIAMSLDPDTPDFQAYNVDSLPSGAMVLVDGVETGKTTPTILSLTPGLHAIEYKIDGYEPKAYSLDVSSATGEAIVLKDTLMASNKPKSTTTTTPTSGITNAVVKPPVRQTPLPVRQTPKPQPRTTTPARTTPTTTRVTTAPVPTTTPVQRPPSTQPRTAPPVTVPQAEPKPSGQTTTTPTATPAPRRTIIDRILGRKKPPKEGETTGGGN
jgi:serine/threonine protein kinase